jgi:hypothetical protein
VEVSDDSGKTTKKNFDLKSNDTFWAKHASDPFPTAAQEVDVALSKYREEAEEITKKTGASSLEDLQADAGVDASRLKAALTLLPEVRDVSFLDLDRNITTNTSQLKERKSQLDMHMTILSAILTAIKDRALDQYYSLEEDITAKKGMGRQELLTFLGSDKRGTDAIDALRLFIFWYLNADTDLSRAEFTAFENALRVAGADITCLPYVKQIRQLSRMTMMTAAPTNEPQQSSLSGDLFGSISSRLTSSLKDAGISSNIDFSSLTKGLKNLMPSTGDMTVTQIMHSLLAPSEASSQALQRTQDWLYFDPKSAHARGTLPSASSRGADQTKRGIDASFGMRRQGFSEAILFTVGGGSVEEYTNVQAFANRQKQPGAAPRYSIVYGSTDILKPQDFVAELQRLGKETS